jgi:phage-related protein
LIKIFFNKNPTLNAGIEKKIKIKKTRASGPIIIIFLKMNNKSFTLHFFLNKKTNNTSLVESENMSSDSLQPRVQLSL